MSSCTDCKLNLTIKGNKTDKHKCSWCTIHNIMKKYNINTPEELETIIVANNNNKKRKTTTKDDKKSKKGNNNKKKEDEEEEELCSICTEKIKNRTILDTNNQCFHAYCYICITTWAKTQLNTTNKASCPLCKHEFTTILTNFKSDTEYTTENIDDDYHDNNDNNYSIQLHNFRNNILALSNLFAPNNH